MLVHCWFYRLISGFCDIWLNKVKLHYVNRVRQHHTFSTSMPQSSPSTFPKVVFVAVLLYMIISNYAHIISTVPVSLIHCLLHMQTNVITALTDYGNI